MFRAARGDADELVDALARLQLADAENTQPSARRARTCSTKAVWTPWSWTVQADSLTTESRIAASSHGSRGLRLSVVSAKSARVLGAPAAIGLGGANIAHYC